MKDVPLLFKFDGGCIPDRYSFGYLAGKDNDLICVKPNSTMGEYLLSPVCRRRAVAIFAFVLKRILISLDENAKPRKSHYDNPSIISDNL